jgi:FdhE protein
MMQTGWKRRIERAGQLISVYPFAAEGLRFYAQVAAFQQILYAEIQDALRDSPNISSAASLRGEIDLFLLLPKFPAFLSLIRQIAPPPLARVALALTQEEPAARGQLLTSFWRHELEVPGFPARAEDERDDCPEVADLSNWLLAWMFLQPYAELLTDRRTATTVHGAPSTCPVCGAKPIVGVLRPEGDGAKKSLICMLCANEWAFRRLYCPACSEEREPQMAYYSAPEIPHVRVDVCDTCRTYLKTVDLTKTGLAVPVVDELATPALDLWASEKGYRKLQINILGI